MEPGRGRNGHGFCTAFCLPRGLAKRYVPPYAVCKQDVTCLRKTGEFYLTVFLNTLIARQRKGYSILIPLDKINHLLPSRQKLLLVMPSAHMKKVFYIQSIAKAFPSGLSLESAFLDNKVLAAGSLLTVCLPKSAVGKVSSLATLRYRSSIVFKFSIQQLQCFAFQNHPCEKSRYAKIHAIESDRSIALNPVLSLCFTISTSSNLHRYLR